MVSGDYDSATDTFSSRITEVILDCILERVEDMPSEMKCAAREALTRHVIENIDGTTFVQKRGQMMGCKLSFPVLCIYNLVVYAALYQKYYNIRLGFAYQSFSCFFSKSLKINGDDIAFLALTREFCEFWCKGVKEYGMSLNISKTQVSTRYINFNSQYFQVVEKSIEWIPVKGVYLLQNAGEMDIESYVSGISKISYARDIFDKHGYDDFFVLFCKLYHLSHQGLVEMFAAENLENHRMLNEDEEIAFSDQIVEGKNTFIRKYLT